jgi:NAD+ synthase
VRQLARHLGVPPVIVDKQPSADLWAGQTDEAELGFTYEAVDRVLYLLVDCRHEVADLVAQGTYSEEFVRAVYRKVQGSQYKRRLPVIAKISARTIDRDFRYPRDWGR